MDVNQFSSPIIRLAHPLAFSAFLQEIGAPAETYLKRNRLPSLCTDANAFVPLKNAWDMFDDAARQEHRHFGWYVGRYVGDKGLSAGLLNSLDSAPSLFTALKRLIRRVSSEASHLRIGIVESLDGVIFYTHYPEKTEEPGYLVSQAYQLEVYVDLIRHFAGAEWQPRVIGLEASDFPEILSERFPNMEIRINQYCGYLSIARSVLHSKVQQRHPTASKQLAPPDNSNLTHAELLSLLLEPHLPEGYPNMRFAASLLSLSTRTLMRRLAENGTSYQAVVDNVRFSKAKHLLLQTGESTSVIARSIGFEDQANFTRMFKRIAGLTPQQFQICQMSPNLMTD
jgi:AraC-like DNA-binding protein